MRWILIDRFLEFQSGKSARALKSLSLAEDIFGEHFPGYPVMPATLLLEGLAQAGGVLVGEANGFEEKVVLAKVPRARFHREVFAGDELIYDVELVHLRSEGASVHGKVHVEEELVVEAEIFFAHLDHARSRQLFGEHNFVFTGELKRLLGLTELMEGHGGNSNSTVHAATGNDRANHK